MIPKKIHYCWLGNNPLPPLAEKCIASWKKYCPDYEIILWNEDNYDFTKHPYMKQAFEAKKWGFVPDYARLDIVCTHGGIYLDTDVEIVKNLDELLKNDFYAGFESDEWVNLGLGFGAIPGHPMLLEMMADYDNYSFVNADGSLNQLPSPQIQTKLLKKHGLQKDNSEIQILPGNVTIYPTSCLAPRNAARIPEALPESYSVHHYMASWCDDQFGRKVGKVIKKIIAKCLGKHAAILVNLKRRILK